MILEYEVENRDPGEGGIEGGLEVLRRLHRIRGSGTAEPERSPEHKERLRELALERTPAAKGK